MQRHRSIRFRIDYTICLFGMGDHARAAAEARLPGRDGDPALLCSLTGACRVSKIFLAREPLLEMTRVTPLHTSVYFCAHLGPRTADCSLASLHRLQHNHPGWRVPPPPLIDRVARVIGHAACGRGLRADTTPNYWRRQSTYYRGSAAPCRSLCVGLDSICGFSPRGSPLRAAPHAPAPRAAPRRRAQRCIPAYRRTHSGLELSSRC